MPLWRQIARGLRVITNRKAAEQDLSDEVQGYLEQCISELKARGLSHKEACRAARLQFGNITAVSEQVRSYGWENFAGLLFSSLRYSVRRLRHSPGFTAVSILMLALGIGASTAIFSVLDGVLLQPLPYPHSEQLVSLRHTAPGINLNDLGMSPSLYFTYSEENRVFQDLCLWSTSTSTVTGIAAPEEVPVLMLTHSLLPMLQVKPELGRTFTASDDIPSSGPTVVLSDGYWHSRYGGDRSILGRRIVIDGIANEVIGILPPSFEFMDQAVSLLMPLQLGRAKVHLVNFGYRGVGRLKSGVTIQQANADIARMLPMVPTKFPPNPGMSPKAFQAAHIAPNLLSLKDDLVGDSGNTLWVLMGTVGIVLCDCLRQRGESIVGAGGGTSAGTGHPCCFGRGPGTHCR